MTQSIAPMSEYIKRLVEENYLLTREAQAAARLPEELQEKAVERSEALRGPAMERIVSDLLNPPAPRRKLTKLEALLGILFTLFMIAALLSGVSDVGNALWDMAGGLGRVAVHLARNEWYQLHLGDEPVVSVLPAPIITDAWNIPHHKVLLRWKTVGQGCSYRIYRTYGKERDVPLNRMAQMNDYPWYDTSVVMSTAFDGEKDTLLGVVAVSADGQTVSPLSNQISRSLDPRYRQDLIEPAPPSTSPPRQHAWDGK